MQAKSDLFFRYLFGTKENEDLRIDFINSVLKDADKPLITSAKVVNPFNLKQYKTDKESILDVKCTTNDGRTITIEMQLLGSEDYPKRALYYWAKTYINQLSEGQHYISLCPVISIHLLDFNLYQTDVNHKKSVIMNDNKLHHYFEIYEHCNKDLCLSEDFQIHFLEMPKLNDDIQNNNDLQLWVDFFKNVKEGHEMLLAAPPTNIMNKAMKKFKDFTADDEMRMMYEAEQRAIRDKASYIYEAQKLGRAEGREEGSHAAKIETAINAIQLGLSTEQIQILTGLSLSEIQNLLNKD
jgi:predicted transposase/invertase (TIGR01784 family)